MRKREKRGFTLIELLVVIAVIALLLAIITPALARAKYLAKRVVCASRIKQSTAALLAYAIEVGDDKLPLGAMGASFAAKQDGQGWSQTDYMSGSSFELLQNFLEDTRTMMCVSIPKHIAANSYWTDEPFIPSWNRDSSGTVIWNAYWIGYNYLGGHFADAWPTPTSPAVTWHSPYRLTDPGIWPLLSCKVSQSETVNKTFISHTNRGPTYGEVDQDPQEIAPSGSSNIGLFDGSVSPKRVRDMEKHHVKNEFGEYEVSGAPVVYGYW
jgi:prepilin-type N-terminal cleavage/methylation domain-containing protein